MVHHLGVHVVDTPSINFYHIYHVLSVSGLNEGVWFMYGEEEAYVLKLVKCQRIACNAGSPKPSLNVRRSFADSLYHLYHC